MADSRRQHSSAHMYFCFESMCFRFSTITGFEPFLCELYIFLAPPLTLVTAVVTSSLWVWTNCMQLYSDTTLFQPLIPALELLG